jgi:trans-aconitate 2-methyltransferase
MWDPVQYEAYADLRSRPFFDLVGRIGARTPGRVVDLGCGTGRLTAALARRWPAATVEGLDNSAEMIGVARTVEHPAAGGAAQGRLRFAVEDLTEWTPATPVDVIVSNAALQWVPGHEALLPTWVEALAPGGWLAFQVPGNFDAPSHIVLRELCRSPRWRDRLEAVSHGRPVPGPAGYLDLLAPLGCAVDAWETTYQQVLHGDDPVLGWVKGTALRPVLAALDDEATPRFLADYAERLRQAYPPRDHGTLFPFRRVFVVAHKTAGTVTR